jgi:RNA polymerase sigma-70 factor, ECF subfamily
LLNDKDAIVACQTGNTEAFRFLVEKYKTRAFYSALTFTKNQEDALDISQDAFYRAYRSIKRFDSSKNFYTWFYKILKNLCINHLHRAERIVHLHDPALDDDPFTLIQNDEKIRKRF